MSDFLEVAKIGRANGLYGECKLHIVTDFPDQQLKKGERFFLDKKEEVELERYVPQTSLAKFRSINTREEVAKLVNRKLYVTLETSKSVCTLKEGEYFWVDMIGARVLEDGLFLGEVEDIDRIGSVDYLTVATAQALIEKGLPKSFMIPYIDRYILSFELPTKTLFTQEALLIAENS